MLAGVQCGGEAINKIPNTSPGLVLSITNCFDHRWPELFFWQTNLWFVNVKEATGSSTASCPFENYLTFCHVKVKLCHFNEITISLEVHSRTYTNFKNVIWSAIFPAPPIFCKDVIFPESRCWGKHSDANRGTYFISTIQFKGQPYIYHASTWWQSKPQQDAAIKTS